MHELISEFVDCGGEAIEVVSGSHTPEQYAEFARYAVEFNLLCSCGSDFHGPGESWRDLGRMPDFPLGCRPVWQALDGLIPNRPSPPAPLSETTCHSNRLPETAARSLVIPPAGEGS